jgi:hypothetical protein
LTRLLLADRPVTPEGDPLPDYDPTNPHPQEFVDKWRKAVLDAYGWPPDPDDEEILRRLLELNLERAE